MNKSKHLVRIFLLFITQVCCAAHLLAQNSDVAMLNHAVRDVTDVIVHDVFTPPVASRIYAYSSIAAYEVMQQASDDNGSLYGKLNEMPEIPSAKKPVNYPLASVMAFYFTARSFIFSEDMISNMIDSTLAAKRDDIAADILKNSIDYAKEVADMIIAWSATDHYKETRLLPRYEFIVKPGYWQPTPPDYADAVEPYWGSIRPFTLDSASQFANIFFPAFSTDTSSAFYKEAINVYLAGKQLSAEQTAIATFWDDNPYTTYYVGHLQFARKKISPGGHWLDITRIAIVQSDCDMIKASLAYAAVSIAIADGFICCWHEKYMYNLIRPETYINQYIDESWRPFLQTPPFPELPSGHSVISSASATILTYLFGDDFQFTDVIESEFDLPARTFGSFNLAAAEASQSRFYGGIHFRRSVVAGAETGNEIGKLVIEKTFGN